MINTLNFLITLIKVLKVLKFKNEKSIFHFFYFLSKSDHHQWVYYSMLVLFELEQFYTSFSSFDILILTQYDLLGT
jgi:uncharacterized protein with PQ loop repeat